MYLPGLGSVEIKGEEIRRIMPGVAMLQTGDWVVPRFNGEPYLRKPPLVNWAIALSIKTLHTRNEWSARLPSVLAVLALALTIITVCGPWLGTNAALAAVIILLTSPGLIDKGRLAEIEAIYFSLFGMALSCWLGWTATGRSRWLVWPVTGLLLGLGLLAKGPAHLAFFYSIVAFAAWNGWRKKEPGETVKTGLISGAHLAGILIMLAVFALWWIPYSRDPLTTGASGVMARQIEQRMGGGNRLTVFANFWHSIENFLPWILGLPLFWRRAMLSRLETRDRSLVEAVRWPIVIGAFGLMFVPGMLPRYSLPLLVPYALFLALLLKAELKDAVLKWLLAAGCLAGAGMLIYGFLIAPRITGNARAFAAQVNAMMPPGDSIYIFDPSVQPVVFYIRGRLIFTDTVKELPQDVPWMLAPETALKLLRGRFRDTQVFAEFREDSGRRFSLLALHGRNAGVNRAK